MTKSVLLGKIKRYYGDAERQRKAADTYYAQYMETRLTDYYLLSQHCYKNVTRALDIAHAYEAMYARGEYQ